MIGVFTVLPTVFMSYCVCQFGCCLAVAYIVSCVTSETNVNCSPRWIVRPQTRTHDATYTTARTLRQCLYACVANNACVTAEWDRNYHVPCWLQYRRATAKSHSNITLYEIISRCDTTSGSEYHILSSRNSFTVHILEATFRI